MVLKNITVFIPFLITNNFVVTAIDTSYTQTRLKMKLTEAFTLILP